jgi:hypothetical protein
VGSWFHARHPFNVYSALGFTNLSDSSQNDAFLQVGAGIELGF